MAKKKYLDKLGVDWLISKIKTNKTEIETLKADNKALTERIETLEMALAKGILTMGLTDDQGALLTDEAGNVLEDDWLY